MQSKTIPVPVGHQPRVTGKAVNQAKSAGKAGAPPPPSNPNVNAKSKGRVR
jgi:hypothetical protein